MNETQYQDLLDRLKAMDRQIADLQLRMNELSKNPSLLETPSSFEEMERLTMVMWNFNQSRLAMETRNK